MSRRSQAGKHVLQAGSGRGISKDSPCKLRDPVAWGDLSRARPLPDPVRVEELVLMDARGARKHAEPCVHLVDLFACGHRDRRIGQSRFLEREEGVGKDDVVYQLGLHVEYSASKLLAF